MKTAHFLHQLYLLSLTPFEIKDLRGVREHNCSDLRLETYLDQWIGVVSKFKSTSDFKTYCHHTGLKEEEIRDMLSIVDISPQDVVYPEWIASLQKILDEFTNIDTNNGKFTPLFAPFLRYFTIELRASLPDQLSLRVIQHLEQQLHQQLYAISTNVLDHELSRSVSKETLTKDISKFAQQQELIKSILSDKYQTFFLSYPMLARKLATTTTKYIAAIQTLIHRFFSDRSEIEYTFRRALPAIYQIHLGKGDFHNGEATAIIEFDDQTKIVYKPRSISITLAYNAFLDWVSYQLNETLLTFQVIDKKQYGWLEFVDKTDCKNKQEASNYFKKAGILLGITYFLNSVDCHYENLIAAGNCPVIIDHETIIAAKVKGSKLRKEQAQTGLVNNTLVDSVLTSMLIPNSINKSRAFVSGFGSSITVPPKKYKGQLTEINAQNKPTLNGKSLELIDHQAAFKLGFQQLFQLIVSQKKYLLSDSSVLANFRNKEIRFMNRSTNVYYQILKSLNKVKYLSDATRYGITLEMLSRAFLKGGNWSEILNSERTQMLEGDIPFFTIDTSTNTLKLPGNEEIDIIEQSAFDNITRKIKLATNTIYENQVHLIDESIVL